MPVFWGMQLYLVLLVGRATSGGVFWSLRELIMILGSLSANGWGCAPVLLVVFFFFNVSVSAFYLFIYLFIYGCVGSSFLCEGFL